MKAFLKRNFVRAFHIALNQVSRFGPATANAVLEPKRILFLSPAHIGDLVIATSLIGVLKSAFPDVEIGFVTGSWSWPVVQDHPLVAYTHTIDDFQMSREPLPLASRLLRNATTRSRALREIRKINYDIAIHLHAGSIDFLDVSWQAGIPVRAAFDKSLWAPLATVVARFPKDDLIRHQGECQADLLRKLGIPEQHFLHRKSSLAESSERAVAEVLSLIGASSPAKKPFVVIHMGAGRPFKEVSPLFWRQVASVLSNRYLVVFTGKGHRESENITQAIAGLNNCINACDALSWQGFVAAVRSAQALFGVDSMAGHVAAAVGTRTISVYHSSAGVFRWRPEDAAATVWTNHLPCAPCHRKRGCAEMTCLTGISPSQLVESFSESGAHLQHAGH